MLKVGDRIKDNDPRMGGRILTVDQLGGTHIRAVNSVGRTTWLARIRIFADGKARRYGFSLMAEDV